MKTCEWCNRELDDEFVEVHHRNHIHEDDRPENRVEICIKCHQRHHRETGYDTIIIKKGEYKPKTLEDDVQEITRRVFLQNYEKEITRLFAGTVLSNYLDGPEKTLKSLRGLRNALGDEGILDFSADMIR